MRKILIGVTGSIAAYKTAELIQQLKKSGHSVRVVMTQSATRIIAPMTLQVLSQHDVRVDLFNHKDEAKIDHIALARWAEQIIIAPTTANFIAKIAHGFADDLLSTICLASDVPIAIAPAMNHLMWDNPITQENLKKLLSRGYQLIAPTAGEQACGEVGIGRMVEPEKIVEWLDKTQEKPLLGKTLMITAGPTIERLDPVRFISNDSSGKMGYNLAKSALNLGAKVILVSGKTALTPPDGVIFIAVESAKEMLNAVMQDIDNIDWFIATAAVSDYMVTKPAKQKMKKLANNEITLTLMQSPDILKSVCDLPNKPFCIGFAAETEKIIEQATAKRIKKGANLIAANDVSNPLVGFNSEQNAITLIGENFQHEFPMMPKSQLAEKLLLTSLDFQNNYPINNSKNFI
ncbi:MAG: bifunctional phosphopantothenoylcysteine decarboxylase/phosphopantothenate--cysteine ligase CoaBC [Ostreibacterium sp.]